MNGSIGACRGHMLPQRRGSLCLFILRKGKMALRATSCPMPWRRLSFQRPPVIVTIPSVRDKRPCQFKMLPNRAVVLSMLLFYFSAMFMLTICHGGDT